MISGNGFPYRGKSRLAAISHYGETGFNVPILIGFLIADAVLILLHSVLGLLFLNGLIPTFPEALRIDRDWAMGEVLTYIKWLVLAALSALLLRRQRQVIYLGFFIFSLVALLDDSLQLHERFASPLVAAIAPGLALPPGAGELIFIAFEGIAVAGTLVYGWIKAPFIIRRQTVALFLLLGAAAFCASAIDFLHVYTPAYSILGGIVGIIEDGGEMVFLSLAVGYAAGLASQARAIPA
ncbi:hypothetical protein RAH32_10600 [Paracoccus sp. WLY502]|uniref:hypothetical protein n=1 Tax=Paracoccus yibinensis TaxID=3068891 RepID=UPI0027964312|nr:hypothetical protein [Paracoccus sp. WLY502]MDQ1900891.1 hypothetical protein [Paracoccus sp. WLY502]